MPLSNKLKASVISSTKGQDFDLFVNNKNMFGDISNIHGRRGSRTPHPPTKKAN